MVVVAFMGVVTQPIVGEYFVGRETLVRLDADERAQEQTRVQAERHRARQLKLAACNAREHVGDGRMMERIAADEQRVQDDAQTPRVAQLAREARLYRVEHLRTHVGFTNTTYIMYTLLYLRLSFVCVCFFFFLPGQPCWLLIKSLSACSSNRRQSSKLARPIFVLLGK